MRLARVTRLQRFMLSAVQVAASLVYGARLLVLARAMMRMVSHASARRDGRVFEHQHGYGQHQHSALQRNKKWLSGAALTSRRSMHSRRVGAEDRVQPDLGLARVVSVIGVRLETRILVHHVVERHVFKPRADGCDTLGSGARSPLQWCRMKMPR